MPSARNARHRLFRTKHGATTISGRCGWISPGNPALVWRDRHRGARILVANQNLLHLVFKCLLSTKHSSAGGAWQALFDAQEGGRKTTTKTGPWILVSRISKHLPPCIHRLVHRRRGRRTVTPALQFCDNAPVAPGGAGPRPAAEGSARSVARPDQSGKPGPDGPARAPMRPRD